MKHLITFLLLFSIQTVSADVPAEQKPEVEHLLEYVRQTDCIMIRNGSEHDGKYAESHIQKKYDYFKDDITSTEDFIRLSATKSTMSGKYYAVRCKDEKEVRTQDWLLEELAAFRSKKPAIGPVGAPSPAR